MSIIDDRIKKQKEEAEKRKQAQINAGGSAPVTPGGVAAQGANEDQAKMAGLPSGSSAQMGDAPEAKVDETALGQAAAQQQEQAAIVQDDTLQTELGEESFDDQQRDAAQERAAAFSEKMQTFGSLGARVEGLVSGAFSGLTAEGAEKNLAKTEGFELNESQLKNLVAPGVNTEDLGAVLTEFTSLGRENPQMAYDYLAANQGLFANPSSGIMDTLESAYSKEPEVLHSTVANLVANDIIDPDKVNFDQLIKSGFVNVDENGTITELGVTKDELQEILGDNWGSLTPEEIGEEVENTREDALANKEKIEEQLADPNLPPQTRIALLDELKRMGAIGAMQYEAEAKEAQIEAADSGKVMIGGKVEDVATLLQDEEIKTDVVNFLSDPESPENKEWAEANPEFAEWLGREMESLNLTKESLETNLDNFGTIQKENEDFVTTNLGGGASLDSNIMNILGYGGQGFEAANYKASDDPVYNMLNNIPSGGARVAAANILNDINKNAPDQIAELKKLSPEKLESLLTNPKKATEFLQMTKMKNEWKTIKNTGDTDQMIGMLFAGGDGSRGLTDAAGVKKRIQDLYIRDKMSPNPETKRQLALMNSVFDKNGDGRVDDPESVKNALSALLDKEGGIESLVDGGLAGTISSFRNAPPLGAGSSLYNTIGKYMQGPGDMTVDAGDISSLAASGVDEATMKQLYNIPGIGMDKTALDGAIRGMVTNRVNSSIDKHMGPGFNIDNFDGPATANQYPGTATAFKNAFAEYKSMANSDDPNEVAAARAQLKKMQSKITQPMTGKNWDEMQYAGSELRKTSLRGDPPPEFSDAFQKVNGKWQLQHVANPKAYKLAAQWATWRNYSDDPNNMNLFFMDLGGKDYGHDSATRAAIKKRFRSNYASRFGGRR